MTLLGNITLARIFVEDLEEAIAFYRDVLEMPMNFSDDKIAIFSPGGCQLGVEKGEPEGNRFSGISFDAPDIEETFRALTKRGVAFTGDPETQYWGGILAHFKDPSGNILTLVQHP